MSENRRQSIALIGNPNSGKTTLFNLLTGARQKVGNWPGVTVEKKFGFCQLSGHELEIVDLPGIYSLEQEYSGVDEKIAYDYLQQGHIDLIINIIDATNLERSLVLTQQLQDMGIPIVVVLNMLDVAGQQGISVTPGTLSKNLGLPVVSMIASRREGVSNLADTIVQHLEQGQPTAEKLDAPEDSEADPVLRRYHQSRRLVNGVVEMIPGSHSLSERLDNVVLNRWLGVPIFLLMIYLMFTFAVNLGAVFIDFFDILFAAVLVDGTTWLLEQISAPDVIITLLAQGVGGGITLEIGRAHV